MIKKIDFKHGTSLPEGSSEFEAHTPTFITPTSFLTEHRIGDRGWIFIQGVVVECELTAYMVEVSGSNFKSSKPTYKVKFYVVQDDNLIEQETVVKESGFKNTIDEILEDIRKNAILYPGNLSPTFAEEW